MLDWESVHSWEWLYLCNGKKGRIQLGAYIWQLTPWTQLAVILSWCDEVTQINVV